MENIYRVVDDEAGFEFTGEFRPAKFGDYFLTGSGSVDLWEFIPPGVTPVLILHKKKRTFKFDGQVFECPEGFVFERVGLVKKEDAGKWATPYFNCKTLRAPLKEITEITFSTFDLPNAIFRKESR